MSNYVYPRFSKKDYNLFRIEGLGLGNLLFIYADALVFAKEKGFDLIWPTWRCFTWGNWKAWLIGRSVDTRTYSGMFLNRGKNVSGLRKVIFRAGFKTINYRDYLDNPQINNVIIEFDEYSSCDFSMIKSQSDFIRENIFSHLKRDISKRIPSDIPVSIAAHIRIGDFAIATEEELKSGCRNVRTPVAWFAERVKEIREITNTEIRVYIFSDGQDAELHDILMLPNVARLFLGDGISDIVALSRAKLMLGSGSTFSMWARYLGRVSTIAYPGQMGERIFGDEEGPFEIEIEKEASLEQRKLIQERIC